MNRKTAATVVIIAALAVLMNGGAATAATGGQVRDDLSPVAGAAPLGLARGHVIVRDDLSPTRLTESSFEQALRPDAARAWSAEARREFHGSQQTVQQRASAWTAEARREFHGSQAVQQQSSTPWTAEAVREFHSDLPVAVEDDQSPLSGTE